MCPISTHVKCHVRLHRGQPRRPRRSFLPAIFAAQAAIDGTFGIRNVSQAAIVFGVNRPAVNNAHILLLSGDPKLVADVLDGNTTAAKAAAQVRNRSKFLKTFDVASVSDRAALGRTAGIAAHEFAST